MNAQPLYDRILVRRKEAQETTAGGIVKPESTLGKTPEGTIVAVGTGHPYINPKTGEREEAPLRLKVGQQVLFGQYAGTDIDLHGETLVCLREEEVIAVIGAEG